jgi:hypothetical protein
MSAFPLLSGDKQTSGEHAKNDASETQSVVAPSRRLYKAATFLSTITIAT